MQQLAAVKRQIRSVAGIGSVCRTLSTVASAKLSHTRGRAAASRQFVRTVRGVVERQQRAAGSSQDEAAVSVWLSPREVHSVLVIAIGADRGLCGGYNSAVGRATRALVDSFLSRGIETRLVVKGLRLERFLRRSTDIPIDTVWGWTRAGVTDEDVDDTYRMLAESFTAREVDEVWACFSEYFSSVKREPRAVRLLPIEGLADSGLAAEGGESPRSTDGRAWFYEPSRDLCVNELLEALVRAQVEDVLLESYAAEQSARMVTMQEACERAERAHAELVVKYNRLRRESITSDLIGVLVAGKMRGESNG